MSNSYQVISPTKKHPGIGVTNLGYPKADYNPAKHNPPTPMRQGAQDALQYPSLDHTGTRIPYWGLKE